MSRLSIIVAASNMWVIGYKGDMPWKMALKPDLKRFKAITTGHPVIMGRNTWESMGSKPLPNRTNIVISSVLVAADTAGAIVVPTMSEAIKIAQTSMGSEEIFFIGGVRVYAEALGIADRVYFTAIHKDYPGDTHWPKEAMANEWRYVAVEHGSFEGIDYTFETLERKK